jgi:hypothetical protein
MVAITGRCADPPPDKANDDERDRSQFWEGNRCDFGNQQARAEELQRWERLRG